MTEQTQGDITLKVNEREIPMNPFVESVFLNVILGLVDSLEKIPQDKESVDIQIRFG